MSAYAFLFPGQGSQHSGMGRELAETFPESREVFESVDRALELPLSQICFSGSEEELALTENTQPAILSVSIAALRVLQERGLRPVAAAGHSLGEYSALVGAGSMELAEAARSVRLRGRFMQEAVGVGAGAMAAIIGLESGQVREICAGAAAGEVLSVANFNGPTQNVVAGHAGAVERAVTESKAAGAKHAVMLNVSAPFHCDLMKPVAERLRPILEAVDFKDPEFPVYCNVDAVEVRNGSAARTALLRQIASPVRWQESIEAMVAGGIETFVEVGPGKVLCGLVRRIRKGLRVMAVGDPDGIERVVSELAGQS